MSAPKAKPAATLKGLVALVGAALLYLVSQVLGIDLTGGQAAPPADQGGAGIPTAPGPAPAPTNGAPVKETKPAPAPTAPKPAPTAPTPAAPKPQDPKPQDPKAKDPKAEVPVARRDDTKLIRQLFTTMVSDRIVEAEGEVVVVLPLDNEGDRHQNFLLELTNGITLKISHNIDLAPELAGLRKGDTVRFHGEYEYNEKGGVVHWTHRDPAGRHEHGWLEHNGKRYE